MSPRRIRGEGAYFRKERPGRATLHVYRIDLGVGGDGKRRSREVSSVNQKEALRKFRELRRQVEDHGTVPTKTMTVSAWLDQWLTEKVAVENDPKTFAGYKSACDTWLKPHLGAYRLDKLEAQHVRDLYKVMRSPGHGRGGNGCSEASVLKVHNVLAKALKDAMVETGLKRLATDGMKRPKPAKRDQKLTTEQAKKLLYTVQTDPNGARRAVALYLGVRQGEILGLQWDRVDLTNGTVDFAWQLQRLEHVHGCGAPVEREVRGVSRAVYACGKVRGGSCPQRVLQVPPGFDHQILDGGLCLTRPKSDQSKRLLPIPAPLMGWLLGRQAFQKGQPNPHGLVFTRPDGRPIDPRPDLQEWHDELDKAGLPQIMLHGTRHTAATLLRERGVPTDVIRSILGHTSATTTDAYLHEDLTLARDALSRLQIED